MDNISLTRYEAEVLVQRIEQALLVWPDVEPNSSVLADIRDLLKDRLGRDECAG